MTYEVSLSPREKPEERASGNPYTRLPE